MPTCVYFKPLLSSYVISLQSSVNVSNNVHLNQSAVHHHLRLLHLLRRVVQSLVNALSLNAVVLGKLVLTIVYLQVVETFWMELVLSGASLSKARPEMAGTNSSSLLRT
jgi:hypothetical protein